MSLKNMLNLRHTVAFRLTVLYAAAFTISSFVAFFIIYMIMSSFIQQRTDQELLNDLAEFSSILELKGEGALKAEMDIEAESDGVEKVFFRLLDTRGEELSSSSMSSWRGVGISRTALKRINGDKNSLFKTLSLGGHPHKVRIAYGAIGPGKILQIGMSLEENRRFLRVFREVFGASIIVIMVFSSLIGWFMARRALSGVKEVTRAARDISKGAFERRVQVRTKGEEIVHLATAFNRMLDRIDDLMTGMKEVTDNIAHDLKTPITRIRGHAESKLHSVKSGAESRELAADTIEECDYLLEMVNTMLKISETEAGINRPEKERLDMAEIIRDAHDLFHPIAQEKGVTLVSKIADRMDVLGDLRGLQRMVVNLLENAIKYTPSGGTVTISLNDDHGDIVFAVHDTGIGISEQDLPNIFRRLYRCETSRSESGFGLGLSLALAVARAHGGDITATSRAGEGSTFTVGLPRVSQSS